MTAQDTTESPLPARPVAPAEADLVAAVAAWAPEQRWFPAKGTTEALTAIGVVDLTDPAGEAEVLLLLLRLPGGGVLQVPVTLRPEQHPGPGVVGAVETQGRVVVVVDGCHDPAFLRAWLATAHSGEVRDGARGPVGPEALVGARVLTGEQSNTSVLLPGLDPPAILKVFRGISTGANPDVEVPLALSGTFAGVPRPLGWLAGSWQGAEGEAVGHLGVLSELVLDARDGFELACEHAGTGEDLGDLAETLGRTTAQMHLALRTSLPTPPPSPGATGTAGGAGTATARRVAAALAARASAALRDAPVLVPRADRVAELIEGVAELEDLPPLQRVHGDYHLGQVLHAPEGWRVLDFEGEPQAPAAERTRPDLALRDLAGMLRSVDYAAAVGGAQDPQWSVRARERLVAGYLDAVGEGTPPSGTTVQLLRALELDKALYEVVYESRNRPDWVHIPLDAVDRLLGATG